MTRKKTVLLLLAVFVFTLPATGQQAFSHMAAGVTVGMDGLGLEVSAPLTSVFQIRAGYSIFVPTSLSFSDFTKYGIPGSIEVNGQQRPLGDAASVSLGLNLGGGKILADIFPSPDGAFHFTVGSYLGNPLMLKADLDASKILQPDEYASYGIQLDGDDPNTNITSDKQGHIKADFKTWALRPYAGIGFGRPDNTDKRVCMTFDIGAMFWGAPVIQSYDYSLKSVKTVELSPEMLEKNGNYKEVANVLRTIHSIPVLPMLKLNVFVRLF